MGTDTKIEWCHHTFNPWRGCTKVSPGCANEPGDFDKRVCGAMDPRDEQVEPTPQAALVAFCDEQWPGRPAIRNSRITGDEARRERDGLAMRKQFLVECTIVFWLGALVGFVLGGMAMLWWVK